MGNVRTNKMSWYMITTLGVSIVIAGQFSGWNLGLVYGWKNMLLGTGLMFLFYVGFLQLIAEMGSTWPSAGGLAKYTSLAFGRLPGGLINISMTMALIAGTGVVSGFIASYGQTLLGIDENYIKMALFVCILILHLAGTKEAMWVIILAGLVAVCTLLSFSLVSLPHFQFSAFSDNTSTISFGQIIKVLPFSLWMFVGVEQAVIASEEVNNPRKDLPRGLLMAIIILFITAAGVLFGALGLGDIDILAKAGDPLLASLQKGNLYFMKSIIGLGAVFGLLASFFSLTYSASRQLFDLSRNEFSPALFARANLKGTPVHALFVVMILGFIISFIPPERIILSMVVLFTLTYFVTSLSFLYLRKNQVHQPRQYRAIGGIATGYVTLILSGLISYACFGSDFVSLSIILSIYCSSCLYYFFKTKSTYPVINES